MKKITIVLACISVTGFFATGVVLAESAAIQTMARITIGLNHFPSDDDKVALQGIIDADDSTDSEAAIATALANLAHKVSAGDAERLSAIVSDDNAGDDARQLAGAVLRINHAASDEDKAALSALAE